MGVAQLQPSETGTNLLQRVDALLYDAKARGRNRVASQQDETSKPPRRSRTLRAAAG
jgi:hypothetical protein